MWSSVIKALTVEPGKTTVCLYEDKPKASNRDVNVSGGGQGVRGTLPRELVPGLEVQVTSATFTEFTRKWEPSILVESLTKLVS